MFERMVYLIDVTRDRLATASDDTRDRLALRADEARERIADSSDGVRLRFAELGELARTRRALILGVLAAVVGGGFLVAQGAGGDDSELLTSTAADAAAIGSPVTHAGLVKERGFTLSLPSGWVRSDTPDGAIFSAHSADGAAQATLWVERSPDLDFDSFVKESLSGLDTLGDDAKVTDRVDGPSLESSSAALRAEIPLDGFPPGPYRVNLRAAGPYRYYLATSIEPGGTPSLLADAETLGSSLRPEVRLQGVDARQ